MHVDVKSKQSGAVVARQLTNGMALENAQNQFRLFLYDPDDCEVVENPNPPSKEVNRFGWEWLRPDLVKYKGVTLVKKEGCKA